MIKRLIALTAVIVLLCGLTGNAMAGPSWKGGREGGGHGDFGSSKVPILVAQLIPASGGQATGGKGALVVDAKGRVTLKIRGLAGSGGPITNTGSLEIDLIVNGAAVAPATFPVPVSGGNADVNGTLPVAAGDTFEITGFRVLDSGAADLLRVGAKVSSKTQRFEEHGTISNLSGTCPSVTFDVDGTTVTTDANTKFEDGTCADLANGVKVEVKGTVQSDGSHLATKVELDNGEGDGEDD